MVEPLNSKAKVFKKQYLNEKEPVKKSEDAPRSSKSVQFDPDEILSSELLEYNLDYSGDENCLT